MKKWLFLIGLGGLGLGSFLYYRRQLALLYNFKWNVEDVKVKKLSLSDTQLIVTMGIVNDADISFTLTGYNFDISIDGKTIANISNKDINVIIPRNSKPASINFLVSMNPKEMGLKNIVSQLLRTSTRTDIKIKGTTSVKMGLFTFRKFPIEVDYMIEDFT